MHLANSDVAIHFTDFFCVDPKALEDYGAFNVSLINDLPLFVDPFLLFNSSKPEYRELHEQMIGYLKFLRDKSAIGGVSFGLLRGLYTFSEVRQNWLGFSRIGNKGSGLGLGFAAALHTNLQSIFSTFGDDNITECSHLEKLCLIGSGVGRDNISDFTTNLIKGFLLSYTQEFAKRYIDGRFCARFAVDRVQFSYHTQSWVTERFYLPRFLGDYVLLTPKDMLTKDDTWINRRDMLHRLEEIAEAQPDEVLRDHLDQYLRSRLIGDEGETERLRVYGDAIRRFPELVDYYIRQKEEDREEAGERSRLVVGQTENLFVVAVRDFVNRHLLSTPFYSVAGNTLDEARQRVGYLKHVIEDGDGYRLFYQNGEPIRREQDVQLLYKLTWYATPCDVNREVNNGRGPVDFKISQGSADSTLVEFKLASNSHLRRNLENQVRIYEKANRTGQSLKVILYFSETEELRLIGILRELGMEGDPNVVTIDARADNKPSASTA